MTQYGAIKVFDSERTGNKPESDDVLRLKDVSAAWLAGHILKAGCFPS